MHQRFELWKAVNFDGFRDRCHKPLGQCTIINDIKSTSTNKEAKTRFHFIYVIAVSQGFEPWEAVTSAVLETAAIDRSANSPNIVFFKFSNIASHIMLYYILLFLFYLLKNTLFNLLYIRLDTFIIFI